MRVVQLIDTLRAGGAERMAVNMARVFSDHGVSNALVVSRDSGFQQERVPGSTSFCLLEKKAFYDLSAFFKLVKFVKDFRPSVIHAHSTSVFWAVLLKAFVPNTRLIWHDHYGLIDQVKPGDRKPEKWVSRWIDGVVVVNEKLKNWVLRETSLSKSHVALISNFPLLYRPVFRNDSLSNPVVLIQLANLRRQKNHFLSIAALEKIQQTSRKDIELWFVGNKNLEPDYTLEIEAYLEERKLQSSVKLLGEIELVEDLFEKAHVGILSSDSEGLPVSLLEYILASLPVVVTDVGECNKVLLGGKLGKVIPSKDVDAFASAIQETIDDYEESLLISQNAKKHIELEYGAEGFITKYQTFVESLN